MPKLQNVKRSNKSNGSVISETSKVIIPTVVIITIVLTLLSALEELLNGGADPADQDTAETTTSTDARTEATNTEATNDGDTTAEQRRDEARRASDEKLHAAGEKIFITDIEDDSADEPPPLDLPD